MKESSLKSLSFAASTIGSVFLLAAIILGPRATFYPLVLAALGVFFWGFALAVSEPITDPQRDKPRGIYVMGISLFVTVVAMSLSASLVYLRIHLNWARALIGPGSVALGVFYGSYVRICAIK